MNKRLVLRLLGAILLIEALAMAPSLAISLLYGDGDGFCPGGYSSAAAAGGSGAGHHRI